MFVEHAEYSMNMKESLDSSFNERQVYSTKMIIFIIT